MGASFLILSGFIIIQMFLDDMQCMLFNIDKY